MDSATAARGQAEAAALPVDGLAGLAAGVALEPDGESDDGLDELGELDDDPADDPDAEESADLASPDSFLLEPEASPPDAAPALALFAASRLSLR